MILFVFRPFALSVVKCHLVVDTFRIHPADMVQCTVRNLVAHLAHGGVKLKAALLNRASLQVNHTGFIAHDITVGATNQGNLWCVAHLAPRESCQFWSSVNCHGRPAVSCHGVTFDRHACEHRMVSLLTGATTTNPAIHIQIVIQPDHCKVGPRALHGSAILPLRCYGLCSAVFSRPSHTRPKVRQQVKAPNSALP